LSSKLSQLAIINNRAISELSRLYRQKVERHLATQALLSACLSNSSSGVLLNLMTCAEVDVAEGKAAVGSATMIIFKDTVMHRSSAALAVNGLDNQQRYLSLGNSSDYVFSDVCTVILNIRGECWWFVNLAATYRITAVIVWGIPDDKRKCL
jgi:hypothetical protein